MDVRDINQLYRDEGWGGLAEKALGILPEHVEAQTRVVARYAAKEIERLRSGGVTAWAVVDKDNEFTDLEMYGTKLDARSDAHWRDDVFPARAPHRVIRVRIVPDTEEQK
jgi:hypothetical protein